MGSDERSVRQAAKAAEEASAAYDKANNEYRAARLKTWLAQERQEAATNRFHTPSASNWETHAPQWLHVLPGAEREGPLSLAELYASTHNAASGITLDTRIFKDSFHLSALVRDAAAQHPKLAQSFQSMMSAFSAAFAAANQEKAKKVARQRSIYKLLQARAALETLKIADQQWIQCSAQPRTMSLRQIQALIRDSPTAANQLFRSPTAGQVPQAADMVLLEHNTLAALVNMCSSLIGCLEEHSGPWEPEAFSEPGDVRCWQLAGSPDQKVLLSSKGVFALFRAGEWEAEQRLSHCSRPEESLSIVTVGTACDRLGQQMKNLGTEPVRAVQAQVEERLASHVKRQLSELVGSCIERALKDASQKRMQGKEACLPEAAKPAPMHAAMNTSCSKPSAMSLPNGGAPGHAMDSHAHIHTNGHSTADRHLDEGAEPTGTPQSAEQLLAASLPAGAQPQQAARMNVAGNKLARRSRWAPVENGLHDSSPASSVIPSAKDQLHCSSAGEREVTKGQQHSSKCAALLEEQRASQIAEFQENGGTCQSNALVGGNAKSRWRGRHSDELAVEKSASRHEHRQEDEHKDRQRPGSAVQIGSRSRDSPCERQPGSQSEHPANRQRTQSGVRVPDPDAASSKPSRSASPCKDGTPHRASQEGSASDEGRQTTSQGKSADWPEPEAAWPRPGEVQPLHAPGNLAGAPAPRQTPSPAAQLPSPAEPTMRSPDAADIAAVPDGMVSQACHVSPPQHAVLPAEAQQAPGTDSSRAADPALRADAAASEPEEPSPEPASSSNADLEDAALEEEDADLEVTPDQEHDDEASDTDLMTGTAVGPFGDAGGPDSMEGSPDELVPFGLDSDGVQLFFAGLPPHEVEEQMEELRMLIQTYAPETLRMRPRSEAPQQSSEQVIIDGRSGAVTHVQRRRVPSAQSAAQARSARQHQRGPNRQPQFEGLDAINEEDDQLLKPEKLMSRRAVREIEELIDSVQETPHSRQRRQPVQATAEQQSGPQLPKNAKAALKKRQRSEDAEEGGLNVIVTAGVRAAGVAAEDLGRALIAGKAGKIARKREALDEACEQEPFICSRMLPANKVSRRSGAVSKKAKRAIRVDGVDEEVAGSSSRAVKRRLDRSNEVNWQKLQGEEAVVKLIRSKVHSWGLTAVKPIQAEQFVIEYTGELIRLSVNSMREKADSASDYRFRVDDQWVVDATVKGGLARFINHCCDPNCYTKIVTVGSAKHILIYAKRAICAGEELSYDYKFETTPGEAPIACTCGTENCRRRLN